MIKRRLKPIAAAATSALVLAAGVAFGAPVTVALYQFAQRGDVASFTKVEGGKCKRKLTANAKMSITLGSGTSRCAFRTSVLADSTDQGPDQEVAASVAISKTTPDSLRKKAYTSVAVRASPAAGYELRLFPVAGKFQLWRDPAGTAPAQVLSSGRAKATSLATTPSAQMKAAKGTAISVRAFDFGAVNPQIVAKVNGKVVYSAVDSAPNLPDGRATQIAVGSKAGTGSGIAGIFDNVAVRVPSPL